jgi:hypothetical protein
MKIIGGFIIFLALYGFGVQITLTGILWLLFGIFLVATQECLDVLMHTTRYIHRSINREQK